MAPSHLLLKSIAYATNWFILFLVLNYTTAITAPLSLHIYGYMEIIRRINAAADNLIRTPMYVFLTNFTVKMSQCSVQKSRLLRVVKEAWP